MQPGRIRKQNGCLNCPAEGDQVTHIKLRVYDTKGKMLATIVNAVLPAGSHQVDFDGVGMPRGMYFLQLSVDRISRTKLIMLDEYR